MSQPQHFSPAAKPMVNSASVGSLSSYPWWLYLIVIVGSFLTAVGGIIALVNPAMLVAPGAQINGAVRVYAGYLVSRNLVIALLLLAALGIRARKALSILMVLTALIQFLDAAMDCLEERWAIVPIVVILGIAFLIGARRVAGNPLWHIASWRDEY